MSDNDIGIFAGVGQGVTPEMHVFGWRNGDGVEPKSMKVGVGVNADDEALFSGVSAYRFRGKVAIENVNHASDATGDDRFLVVEDDMVKYRSGEEILADIGIAGTANYVTMFTGVSTVGNSPIRINGANAGLGLGTAANLFHLYANNATDLLETADLQQYLVEQDGAGDAGIGFELTGGQRWSMGIDNSDGDQFKLRDITNSLWFLGANPNGALELVPDAHANISMFQDAGDSETRELYIHGFRNLDANRSLQIGVGVDAADTASFDGVSNYYFDGNVGIGTAAPATNAKLDLRDGSFYLTDTDVDTGMTTLAITQCYGIIAPVSATAGGLQFQGMSDDAATAGMSLIGIIGSTDPTDTTPAILLQTGKKSGTSWGALGAAETSFQLVNYATTLITVLGNGNIGIGTVTPVSLTEIQGGTGTTGAVLTLGTKENAIDAADVLGRINFYAPLEASTGDANLVAGSIVAIAEASFTDAINATSLAFQTGASEVATTKAILTSVGNFGLGTTTFDASVVKYLAIGNGTEPSAHTDDQIYIGSKDSADNTATLALYLEQAVEDGAPTPDKKVKVWINGAAYYLCLDAV
jgi:hypothetical protein